MPVWRLASQRARVTGARVAAQRPQGALFPRALLLAGLIAGPGLIAGLAMIGAWPSAAQAAAPPTASRPAAARPTPSGLPVPRFASLKVGRVNVRQGPSRDNAVSWVYVRKGWPVEVIAEQDVWRRVRDRDGQTGWVHGKLLDGARTAILQGASMHAIRAKPQTHARPVAWAEPGVLVELKHCDRLWCEVEGPRNVEGYLERTALWGLLPGETIE